MPRTITEIIIHCSATPKGRVVTRAEIDRWHRKRGFAGIGYHYLIHLNGAVEVGRSEESVGAHCAGHNASSIGVCYIGGMSADMKHPEDTRTPEQRSTLKTLIGQLIAKYPNARVFGHNQFAAKACPCFDVSKEF